MLIREVVKLVRSVRLSDSRKVALVCSFEPLHLKTYLQAFLAERLPGETPEVVSFGYDQLDAGLAQTATLLKIRPTLLCLSWEDVHPGLTWRTRGGLGDLGPGEVARQGNELKRRLDAWIESRRGAETYVAIPPIEYMPQHDACPPLAWGHTTLTAAAVMGEIARMLSAAGARILRLPSLDLDYQELLRCGCPLSPEGSELIARRFVEVAFRAAPRKKALVTDLDGTLWMGILAEDGLGGVACRPEGPGYPFHVFQKYLVKLKGEGVLLAFCSKNNPGDILPEFDRLDMPLKLSDFATYRCNWESKSDNIRSMCRELNTGSEAVVVVDDDRAELAEIGLRVPGVALFATPSEARDWKRLMDDLQEQFATWSVTEEDRLRTASVTIGRQGNRPVGGDGRGEEAAELGDSLAHLRDMALEVTLQGDGFDEPRTLELINKTNQFNLTGERFARDEWLAWASTPGAFCISARLRDRFGDFGTICVVTGRMLPDATAYVRQLVVSCRAFGRGVETIVLGGLLERSSVEWLCGPFRRTGKNEPAERFLVRLGCDVSADGWRVNRAVVLDASRAVLEQTSAVVRPARTTVLGG